jgi:hypothetical protein
MVKCQTIKLQFTLNSTNEFDISTKIYGSHIECVGKAAGKIGNDCFSAKYRFNIDAYTLKICSIHFIDVTHVGKSDTPLTSCNKYYNISDVSDSSSSCYNSIDDAFEQTVYNSLYSILSKAEVINKSEVVLTVRLTNNTTINYLLLHIKIGNHSYGSSSSAYNENSKSSVFTGSITDSGETSSSSFFTSKTQKSSESSKLSKSSELSKTKISSELSKSRELSKSSESTESSESTKLKKSRRKKKSGKSSKSHKKKNKIIFMQKIIKLIAWGTIISFIIYIFKNKIN